MPHDENGTPFIFAVWITHVDNAVKGRVIDYLTMENEEGIVESEYGIEDAHTALSGINGVKKGDVVLSDRAQLKYVNGKEVFDVVGTHWVVGHASSDMSALELIQKNIIPGIWTDPRLSKTEVSNEYNFNL